MPLIAAVNLHKQYATHQVLEGASFELNEGERVGLVGPNGAGKTTLFRILIGQETPELGQVTFARRLTFGYLAQIQKFQEGHTLRQEAATAFGDLRAMEEEMEDLASRMAAPGPGEDLDTLLKKYADVQERHEAAGGFAIEHRIDAVLLGLGFRPEQFDTPVGALSGGQKSRLALARILLKPCDVLLLDEPTNHLDLDAVDWLEGWLEDFKGAVLVISHDRSLLDRVTTKTIELERRRLFTWPGNYSEYVELKAAKLEADTRFYEKQQAFIAKTEEFIRRFQAGQRSKQARGRKTRLERAREAGEFLDRPGETRKTVRLKLEAHQRSGQDIVLAKNLGMTFDESRWLFRDLTFRIDRGERIGIVGPNGCGKSTLLKLIVGRLCPAAGEVKLGQNVTVGYYDQQHADLDRSNTVINELWKLRPKASEGEVRSMLGRFLFTGEEVYKPVAKLSGGEQSRVVLAKLIWSGHNFLVLDEPTNHLDIPSCEALEAALDGYDGTLLVVSHDRYFLDRLVDRILAIGPDGCEDFNGGWSDYAVRVVERKNAAKAEETARKAAEAEQARKERERQRQKDHRQKSPTGKSDKAGKTNKTSADPYARMTTAQLESAIVEREEKLAALSTQLGEPAVARNPAMLAELKEQYESVEAELSELNAAWERRAC